jgi:hypothetical protein
VHDNLPLPQVAGFDAPIAGGFWAPTDTLTACLHPAARSRHNNALWRAVDVNRPVRPSCVPVAVLAARARTVTGGLTSTARLVTWGTVRKTTSGGLNTVSPSQLRPGMVKRRENGEIGIFSFCLPVDISSVTGRCQHCWSHAKAQRRKVRTKCSLSQHFTLAPLRLCVR